MLDVVNILHPEILENGTRRQFYTNVLPLTPGSKVRFGNVSSYPVNCKYGSWGSWDECSSSCGYGVQIRIRNIQTSPRRGGNVCSSLIDFRDCVGPCKSTVNLTVILIIVGVVVFLVAVTVAYCVGRRTTYIILFYSLNIGNTLSTLKPEEKSVMIDQLAQGNYNTLT